MLSGIRFVDQTEATAELKKDTKARKQEKKAEKKARKQEAQRAEITPHQDAPSRPDAGSSRTPTASEGDATGAVAAQPSSEREHWMTQPRDNPLGLPAPDTTDVPPKAETEPQWGLSGPRQAEGEGGAPGLSGVGDAGASWRMKALRRAQAQAAERGEDVAAVVAERWGSMQQLKQGLNRASAAHPRAHMHLAKERRGEEGPIAAGHRARQSGEDKADYLEDVRSDRSKMQRPGRAASLSWRGKDGKERQKGNHSRLHDAGATGRSSDRSLNAQEPEERRESSQDGAAQPAQEQRASRQGIALPLIDSQGRAAPGAFGRERAGAGLQDRVGRKPHRLQRYGQEGQRERWFADDDAASSLTDVVLKQRHEGAEDIDANLADNIARSKRFRGTELDADAEYDVDGGLDMYESRMKKGHQAKAAKRERSAQVADAKRMTSALDRCQLCFSSAARRKHLTLAIGQSAYLALPSRGSLAEGHCLIVPSEHVASARQVDEAVWAELRNFKKALLQMAMSQGREIVFMETAKDVGGLRSHAVIEAVPLPAKAFAKAPLYFKKAVDDSSQEWSQHHAKRLIDTRSKGLRGSIPPNFAYFHVEFGMSAGYVHILDDEQTFDSSFGRNILIGLLDLPPEDMHRRGREQPPAVLQKRAAEFAAAFAPYDWTLQLE
ncbi:hypothetical protein WJX73_004828 [Symbiochloris irregularis]|uniref:CWF19-like protein 2 n=1 Tax=Symbiochloris irregularis TaxID=706552 RepID=A0AAW1P2Z3_9CHLO